MRVVTIVVFVGVLVCLINAHMRLSSRTELILNAIVFVSVIVWLVLASVLGVPYF